MAEKKLEVRLIFEMLGKPKEHLEEVIRDFIEKIGKENGISLSNKIFHDAKPAEEKDKEGKIIKTELFITFAEVELKADNIHVLLSLMFRYLPSNVEIMYPEQMDCSNRDFNMILNEVIERIHYYDSIAKAALFNNQMLAKKFEELKNSKVSDKTATEKKQEDIKETKEKEQKKTKKEKV